MDKEVLRPVLSQSSLLAGLDDETLTAVLSSGSWRQVKPNISLFHQDDPPTQLYMVGSGLVKMSQVSPGGTQFTLHLSGPGDVIGCAAVFQQFPYPATAHVVDESVILSWGAGRFLDLMKQHPQLSQNALAIVSNRARDFVMRLGETASKKVEQRIASAVLRLSQQAGRKVEEGIEVPFNATRQDLAEMTGATYFTVSRTLSGWKKDGIIDSGRRHILIKAPHRLFKIAEDV